MTLAFLALLLAAGEPDGFDRVLDALAGARSPAARARAAGVLASEGARPAAGQPDLAAGWRRGPPLPAYRDRVLGPAYRTLMLRPGEAFRVEQTFLAGQRARVGVAAASDGFRLSITDEDRRIACPAARRRAQCSWIPPWTTRVVIDLRNTGKRAESFYLLLL